MRSKKLILIFLCFILISCNPEKELPRGTLTGNSWFVEQGNPNTLYDASIWLSFTGGSIFDSETTVTAWEGGSSTKSCICEGGEYTINDNRNEIVICNINNPNCPWMSKLNGTYKYQYDGNRDGYNKFMFRKENIVITHLFDESGD